jgi:[ribosomal protein S5]-alanine N-acetyltransferase
MKYDLIPFQMNFLDSFIRWRTEERSRRHNPFDPKSKDEILTMLLHEGSDLSEISGRRQPEHQIYRWFILRDADLVGHVSLGNVNQTMKFAEIAYAIDEVYQGQGIATAVLPLFVKKVFRETDLRKLIAHVHDENLPSARLLDRFGFKREGYLREHYLINGKPANEILFGLLRSDLADFARG